jgi:hypothetical protein
LHKKHKEPECGPLDVSKTEGKGKKLGPELHAMTVQNLESTSDVLDLHAQAVFEGIISRSEAERVRFVTAVEHSLVIGARNPCGLLMRLIRGKLWHYCTCDDESAALARLKRRERQAFKREHGRIT